MLILYIYRFSSLAVSIILLKSVLGLEEFIDTRIYLAAISISGMISIVEFGLGDVVLRKTNGSVLSSYVVSEIKKSLAASFALVVLCCFGVFSFYHHYFSLEKFLLVFFIMLGGVSNLVAGVYFKACIKIKDLKKNILIAAPLNLFISLSALVVGFFQGGVYPILMIIAAQIVSATMFFMSMISRGGDECEGQEAVRSKGERFRRQYGLENIINPMAISALGLYISAMTSPEDVEEYSVILRVVNVLTMFAMLELMRIWREKEDEKVFRVMIVYVLGVFSSSFLVYATSQYWYPAFISDSYSSGGISFFVLLLMVFWRGLSDVCSQISKYKDKVGVAIINSIAGICMLVAMVLVERFFYESGVLIDFYLIASLVVSFAFIVFIVWSKFKMRKIFL